MDVDIQGFTISTIPGPICTAEITRQPPALDETFAKAVSNLGEAEVVGHLIRDLVGRGFIVAMPSDVIAGYINHHVEIWTIQGARWVGRLAEGHGTSVKITGPEHGPGPHMYAVLSELSANQIVSIHRRS